MDERCDAGERFGEQRKDRLALCLLSLDARCSTWPLADGWRPAVESRPTLLFSQVRRYIQSMAVEYLEASIMLVQKESGHHGRSKESSHPFIYFRIENQLSSKLSVLRIHSLHSYIKASAPVVPGPALITSAIQVNAGLTLCSARNWKKKLIALPSACIFASRSIFMIRRLGSGSTTTRIRCCTNVCSQCLGSYPLLFRGVLFQ